MGWGRVGWDRIKRDAICGVGCDGIRSRPYSSGVLRW